MKLPKQIILRHFLIHNSKKRLTIATFFGKVNLRFDPVVHLDKPASIGLAGFLHALVIQKVSNFWN